MMPLELAAECQKAVEQGLQEIVLIKPMPKKGFQFKKHCMTPFGYGRVLSVSRDGGLVFSIKVYKVKRYLERILKDPIGPADERGGDE